MAKAVEVSELLMALALGSLAVDEALRRVRFQRREGTDPSWLLIGLLAAPVLWLAGAIVVVPSLIEAAYHGRSLELFNALITNEAGRPIDYYLETWHHVTWVVFGNFVLAEVVFYTARRFRAMPRLRPNGWSAFAAGGFPALYAVSFGIAASLALVADGQYNLAFRLNDHFSVRLPALGHHAQAEKIAVFLEANPKYAGDSFWIHKAHLEETLGRPDDARRTLEHALVVEEERHAARPNDPRVLRRLGLIHRDLGNGVVAFGFFDHALDAWIEEIAGVDEPARVGRMYAERARIFTDIGAHDEAIDAYLTASHFAEDAELQMDLGRKIHSQLVACGQIEGYVPEVDGFHRDGLEWDEIQRMSERAESGELGREGPRWCPAEPTHVVASSRERAAR